MRVFTLTAMAMALGIGCGEAIDPAGLPSADGYTDWYRLDVTGSVPGHGDTYRIIYVNELGRDYGHAGAYAPGTVIVKEIRSLDGDQAGDLLYVAIMRKIDEDGPAAAGLPIDGDWLFTSASEVGASETYFDYCFAKCHVQGPIDWAWYDYGR
jgi:hypothetical protein